MRPANDYTGYRIVILYPLKSLGTLETQKTTGIPVNIVWEGIRLQLWQRGIIHIYEFKPLTLVCHYLHWELDMADTGQAQLGEKVKNNKQE